MLSGYLVVGERTVRMRRHKSKTLRWHFLRNTLVISLLVLIATLTALGQFERFNFARNHMASGIELARAIDAIAMVTTSTDHIQQFVNSSVPDAGKLTVKVVDKDSQRIIATNSPADYLSPITAVDDAETASIVRSAIRYGQFDAEATTLSGRILMILPLTSARHTLAGNFVLNQVKPSRPDWHQTLRPIPSSASTWLTSIFQNQEQATNAVFAVPQRKFSGIIVIENGRHWTAGLMSGRFRGIAILICIGWLLITLSGWYFCHRYILQPVSALSAVIKDQRRGKSSTRAGRSHVSEFDHLATQWNGLLNYRKAAEERQRVLSKVLEHAPIGIEVTDPNAMIEYANPAYLKMTGFSLVDALGKTPKQLLRSKRVNDANTETAGSQVHQGKKWHGEFLSKRKDDSEFINEVTLHPVISDDGSVERIIAVRQDITERKAYEDGLIEARRVSQAAEKSKSEFIARMSHELRTPFNSIIGFADIIANQQLGPVGNDTYLEFARIIEQSATGLLAIINSIIDLSRTTANQQSLDEVPIDLHALATNAVRANLNTDSDEQPVVEIHDKLKGYGVRGDERLLDQMLSNVVSNAVKFNRPDGRVDITMRRDRQNRIILEVKDTGIGISKSDLDNVLKPFIQLHAAYNREHDGIGLGLTLAENQAAVHDAEIKITSRENHGTKVRIMFPDYRTVKPAKSKRQAIEKHRILEDTQKAA